MVILEGWCVGCKQQVDLDKDASQLELEMDPRKKWRFYVNAQIISRYLPLWRKIDFLIYIEVPKWDCVIRWRGQQATENGERLSSAELVGFIQHFERISRAMFEEEGRTETHAVVKLEENHRILEVVFKQ